MWLCHHSVGESDRVTVYYASLCWILEDTVKINLPWGRINNHVALPPSAPLRRGEVVVVVFALAETYNYGRGCVPR